MHIASVQNPFTLLSTNIWLESNLAGLQNTQDYKSTRKDVSKEKKIQRNIQKIVYEESLVFRGKFRLAVS
jgi:hypothetical protein